MPAGNLTRAAPAWVLAELARLDLARNVASRPGGATMSPSGLWVTPGALLTHVLGVTMLRTVEGQRNPGLRPSENTGASRDKGTCVPSVLPKPADVVHS